MDVATYCDRGSDGLDVALLGEDLAGFVAERFYLEFRKGFAFHEVGDLPVKSLDFGHGQNERRHIFNMEI